MRPSMITTDYYMMLPFRRACESAKYLVTLPWVLLANIVSGCQGESLQTNIHVS